MFFCYFVILPSYKIWNNIDTTCLLILCALICSMHNMKGGKYLSQGNCFTSCCSPRLINFPVRTWAVVRGCFFLQHTIFMCMSRTYALSSWWLKIGWLTFGRVEFISTVSLWGTPIGPSITLRPDAMSKVKCQLHPVFQCFRPFWRFQISITNDAVNH